MVMVMTIIIVSCAAHQEDASLQHSAPLEDKNNIIRVIIFNEMSKRMERRRGVVARICCVLNTIMPLSLIVIIVSCCCCCCAWLDLDWTGLDGG